MGRFQKVGIGFRSLTEQMDTTTRWQATATLLIFLNGFFNKEEPVR